MTSQNRLPSCGRAQSNPLPNPPSTRAMVLELLQPGTFVRLRNQPPDLPPFQLIHCRGGRCWVRQQAWGALVQWEVEHRKLMVAA